MKEKARPIPLHLQKDIVQELEKLLKTGHLEKIKHVVESCFVSPVVITVKNDKLVEIAIDSRKLNYSCINIRPPYVEHGRTAESNFGRDYKRANKRTEYIEN